jgi:HEAT repeat protein
MPTDVPSDPLAELRTTGETLPDELKASILALGKSAVPSLLALIDEDFEDREPLAHDDLVAGWPPVHAVRLLGEMKAEEAIQPFVRILRELDADTWLSNDAELGLAKIGPPIVEPVLAALAETSGPDERGALACALARCGVKDERVFQALAKFFEQDRVLGSFTLADYGDERALPLLREAIETFVPDPNSVLGARDLAEYVDAYEQLAGSLPADLAARVKELRETWAANQAALLELRSRLAVDAGAFQSRAAIQSPARSTKIGRNDPCPCKSGKKHKKCCLGKAAGEIAGSEPL